MYVDILEAFSNTYFEAREKFLAAAKQHNAEIKSIEHPERSPDGKPIFMDIAVLGPADAETGVMIISGTHGPEAYCGSAIQLGLLGSPELMSRLSDKKLVFVHGHNPYGWTHIRRGDENNIDVNRNYCDFKKPYATNEKYKDVQDLLMPEKFDEAAEAAIFAWIEEHGQKAFATAAMVGQRIDPQGFFYGGHDPVWTHKAFRSNVVPLLEDQKKVFLVDLHTGLGEYADGIILHIYPKGSEKADLIDEWFEHKVDGGMDVVDDDVQYENSGSVVGAWDDFYPDHETYAMVVEYGTAPLPKILIALMKDNWLHVKGDVNSEEGRAIKQELLDSLYPNNDHWKQGMWRHASWMLDRLTKAL